MRFLNYILFFTFVALAFFAISELSGDADAASVTWKQTSGSFASNNNNWENGTAPADGDIVYFTSLSTAACSFDLTGTYIGWVQNTGYSGTITQTASFGTGYLVIKAGTLTTAFSATVTYTITITGNYLRTAGTESNLHIIMAGTSQSISTNDAANWNNLQVNNGDTVSVNSLITVSYGLVNNGNINIASSKYILTYIRTGSGITNTGIISGLGILRSTVAASVNWAYSNSGTISCGQLVYTFTAANYVVTLTSGQSFGDMSVNHGTGGYTVTLALGTYNHIFKSLVVDVRSILTGTGTVTINGNYDSHNGTVSGYSGSISMAGTNPWIKTPSGNTINGLTWIGTNLRFASSLNVTKTFWVGGSYTLGGKTVTIGTGTNVTVTLGNSWTVPGTRYWGNVNITGTLTASSVVSVWANSTCSINGTVTNVVLHVKQMTTFKGSVGYLFIENAYRTHFYGNGTWSAIYWNLTTTWYFHPKTSMVYSSPVYSKGQMRVIDPTDNAHYIEVVRFDTNVGFSIYVKGWEAEIWEFVVTSTSATSTLFTYNLFTPNIENEGVLVYINGVYNDEKNMTLGAFSFNEVFNSTSGARDYLIVCTDFEPPSSADTFNYGVIGLSVAILGLLTYAAFRAQPFYVIAGFGWIVVAILEIQPIQNTLGLLCLGVGLIFSFWGVYRLLDH